MGKKVIRLTENDLRKIVLKVIEKSNIDEQISQRTKSDVDKTLSTEDDFYVNTFVAVRVADKLTRLEKYKARGIDISAATPFMIGLWAGLVKSTSTENNVLTFIDREDTKEKEKSINYLISLMDEESKAILEDIKVNEPNFYGYFALKAENLVGALRARTDKKTRTVSVMKAGVPAPPPEEKPASVEMPVIEYTDTAIPFDTKFESCSPTLKDGYVTAFKESFSKALTTALAAAQNSNTNPNVTFPGAYYINSIKIISSSSRVPHTSQCDAKYYINNDGNDEQGFLNLSTDRANAIKSLVSTYITDNSESIKIPSGDTVYNMSISGATGPKWEPAKTNKHEDYRSNQRASVIISFMVIPQIKPIESPGGETVQPPSEGYLITVLGTGKTYWKFEVPEINIPKMNTGGGGSVKSTGRKDRCPSF